MHPSSDFVVAALGRWGIDGDAAIRLVNFSENHTFAVETEAGRFCLRVHRPGYQSAAAIRSELTWLDALRRETGLPVPQPLPGLDGSLLQRTANGADERHCVLFDFIEGREPEFDAGLEPIFETLGSYAARLHTHVSNWRPPDGFERQSWSAEQVLDSNGLWGNWRLAPGVDTPVRRQLERLDTRLRADLDAYGMGHERFGLIHADMRLGNLLVDGDRVSLIDFDDSGFSWFAYDFAAAVSFHEAEPTVERLKAAWLRGYQPVRRLDAEDIAAMDTMILLRRMALLAWIGSHNDTDLARRHEPGYAEGTVALAARYLDGRSLWG